MNQRAKLLNEIRKSEQEVIAKWIAWDVADLDQITVSDHERELAQRDLVRINAAFAIKNDEAAIFYARIRRIAQALRDELPPDALGEVRARIAGRLKPIADGIVSQQRERVHRERERILHEITIEIEGAISAVAKDPAWPIWLALIRRTPQVWPETREEAAAMLSLARPTAATAFEAHRHELGLLLGDARFSELNERYRQIELSLTAVNGLTGTDLLRALW